MLRPGPGFGEAVARTELKRSRLGRQEPGMKKRPPALWAGESSRRGEELRCEIAMAAPAAAARNAVVCHAGGGGNGHALAAKIEGRPLAGEAEQIRQGGDHAGKAGVNFEMRRQADHAGDAAGVVGDHGTGDFIDAASQRGYGGPLVPLPHQPGHKEETARSRVINDGVSLRGNYFWETIAESASADFGEGHD